jgi:hypothetical protein
MTIEELKEILLPMGFECVLHSWVGDPEPTCYLFKIPNSPILENFIIYEFDSRNRMIAYDSYWGQGKMFITNLNEQLNYDLKVVAESYIKSYKEHEVEKNLKDLTSDFI